MRRFRSGMVFDTSGSMGSKLQKSRQAVAQFFKTANPEDEFFLVEFNDRPELVVPFTAGHRRDPEPADVHAVQGHARRCWTACTWR